MTLRRAIACLTGAALLASAPALAQQSWAVSFGDLPGCRNRVEVATDLGTSILVWPDRPRPPAGEDLRGNFQTLGRQIVERKDGTRVEVFVERAGLTLGQVMTLVSRCFRPRR